MPNAAHELADVFTEWRDAATGRNSYTVLAYTANDRDMSVEELMLHVTARLASVRDMVRELEAVRGKAGAYTRSLDVWTRSAFRLGQGWLDGGSYLQPDNIISQQHLDLLTMFADYYDATSSRQAPDASVIEVFAEELNSLVDFVNELDAPEKSKALLLRKLESTRIYLMADGVSLDAVFTKIGELLGLLLLLAESITDGPTKTRIRDRAATAAAHFFGGVSVNVLSGVATAAVLPAIGMG